MRVTEKTKAMAQAILDYHDLTDYTLHEQASFIGTYTPEIEATNVGGVNVNICNTTMCAAGTAVFLSMTADEFKAYLRASGQRSTPHLSWEELGGKLLGLNRNEGHYLFYDTSNIQARKALKLIAAGDKAAFMRLV